MNLTCNTCAAPVIRVRREGIFERLVLAPIPLLRPYYCAACATRELRLRVRLESRPVLLVLAGLALGAVVVHLLWLVRTTAPDHPGLGYEPKDMERQQLIEKTSEGR